MKTTAFENFVRKACQSRFFFCEKEFASIEILIQIITVTPPNSSDNSISRRIFIKTSALSVGAVTCLSRGIALASEEGGSSGPQRPRKWFLFVFKDPSTEDMEFSPVSSSGSNAPAMQRNCYEQYEGPNTHDGKIPIRTFYYRRQTPYNGGENSAVLELRSAGPVQCARDENNKEAPDPDKALRSSVTISQCRVRAGTVKNQAGSNPFDFFETAQLFNDFTQAGSPEPVFPLGYVSFESGTATLSIDQDTGKVTYGPSSQVIPFQQAGAYETSFLNTGLIGAVDYRVQAEGVVRPSVLVQGVVGVGEESELKWNFGVGAEVRKNNVVTGLQWTASKSVVTSTMQWIIYKAYREVLADQTLGPVIVVGEATPENAVEIVATPTCERH